MKKAWIFQGGWDGHEPKLTSARFAGMLRDAGYEVTIHDSLTPAEDLDALMQLDLIVACWTMGEISGKQVDRRAVGLPSRRGRHKIYGQYLQGLKSHNPGVG